MALVDQSEDCWRWLGGLRADGRGQINMRSKTWVAHRLIYTLLIGEIPPGLTIDHLCRNGICCNPAHMEPVTAAENTRRMLAVRYAGRDSCPAGHLRAEFGRVDRGSWYCAECNRAKLRARYVPHPRPIKADCPAGHPRAEFGVKYASGWQCRECCRLRAKARRALKRTSA
jgi:hypothetical protein